MELPYGEICSQISRFVRQSSNPLVLDEIRSEVNLVYSKIAQERDWDELLTHVETGVSFSAGKNYISLSNDCVDVRRVLNKTDDKQVEKRVLGQMLTKNISQADQSGDPLRYSVAGMKPINTPLSEDSKVTIVSSDASDITGHVRVRGLDNSSNAVSENISLDSSDGSTDVLGNVTWKEGWSINSISTTQSFLGTVDIKEGSTVIASIPPGGGQSKYCIVIFEETPSLADSLIVLYKRSPFPLVNDEDVPEIPVSRYLIEEVKGRMRQYDKRYQQASVHTAQAQESIHAVLSEKRLQGGHHAQARPTDPRAGMYRAY